MLDIGIVAGYRPSDRGNHAHKLLNGPVVYQHRPVNPAHRQLETSPYDFQNVVGPPAGASRIRQRIDNAAGNSFPG